MSPSPTTDAVRPALVLLGGLIDEIDRPREMGVSTTYFAARREARGKSFGLSICNAPTLPQSAIARSHGRDPSSVPTTAVRTIQRPPEMLKDRRPRDQGGRLTFFERGLGIRATRMPPTINSFPHGSQSSRRQPRLLAHRRTGRSTLIVSGGPSRQLALCRGCFPAFMV
jgi:hypothetical protein